MPSTPNLPSFSPFVIADYRGYFRDEGLKVELTAVNGGGVEAAKQVGAGNAPFGYGVIEVTMFLRAREIPVKTVALLGGKSLMHVAVWEDDATINEPKDFKGKTFTVGSYQDAGYYSFLGMLAKFGLGKKDVNIHSAGRTGVWQLFAQHKADGMVSTPDWTALAEGAGAKVKIIRSDDYFPGFASGIFASDKTIKENPKLVARVVRAVLRAFKEINADPAGATRDFIAAVPSMKDKEEFVRSVIASYVENVYSGQAHPGMVDPARLKVVQEFYVGEKIIQNPVPIEDLYTNQFVQ